MSHDGEEGPGNGTSKDITVPITDTKINLLISNESADIESCKGVLLIVLVRNPGPQCFAQNS